MERIGSKTVWQGKVGSVRIDEFRHPDGSTSVREVIGHPGAVAMVAHDERFLYLVRQPREAVGEDALLELPAGKLDMPGESPVECAKRELAEEEVTVYLATELEDTDAESDEEERLEVVAWPLEDLDRAIEECRDAKS